ncbi:MAG: hypothetical protein D0530_04965 [Methylococcales bacterium]|nr:MAG: hypothetical protein D0530_04965 [Methylococcales bacterium]
MPEDIQDDYAEGLPDPFRFGNTQHLPLNQSVPFVVQEHNARRAGRHFDYRIHGMPEDRTLSFATKKNMPGPGDRPIMLFQQPLHRGSYSEFEGTLESGYGAGDVRTHEKGSLLVTEATPTKIKFVVTHRKNPEEFTLVRKSSTPAEGTARAKQTQGGSWLMFNTTPNTPPGHEKVKYKTIPADQIDRLMTQDYAMSEKIDGAMNLLDIVGDKVNALSYRKRSETGAPIVHTQRLGLSGKKIELPKELQDATLIGETWGERNGKAIPTAELGGLLNSSVAKSLKKQQEEGIKLRMALFGIDTMNGEKKFPNMPLDESRKLIQQYLKHLPKDIFHEPEYAYTEEDKRKLWGDIKGKQNQRTSEGIVAHPVAGGVPTKVKLFPESDVHIREIFPGMGKYKGKGAGGFGYSLDPEGDIVGEVGSGFTDEDRADMLENADQWIGRKARIAAQEQFGSGAYRAPSFIARNEDYTPVEKRSYIAYQMGKQAAVGSLSISLPDIPIPQSISSQPTTDVDKKKQMLRHQLLYPGLALVAGGAGMVGAGNIFLDPESHREIREFGDAYKNWERAGLNPGDPQIVLDYVSKGHDAAKLNVLGVPSWKYMRAVRSAIRPVADKIPALKPFTWNDSSREHYTEYAKSGPHAYTKQISEGSWYLDPVNAKSLEAVTHTPIDPAKLPGEGSGCDADTASFNSALAGLRDKFISQNPTGSVAAFRDYALKDPTLAPKILRAEWGTSHDMVPDNKMYSDLLAAVGGVRNALLGAGLVTGGVGVAALAKYLHSKNKARAAEKKELEKVSFVAYQMGKESATGRFPLPEPMEKEQSFAAYLLGKQAGIQPTVNTNAISSTIKGREGFNPVPKNISDGKLTLGYGETDSNQVAKAIGKPAANQIYGNQRPITTNEATTVLNHRLPAFIDSTFKLMPGMTNAPARALSGAVSSTYQGVAGKSPKAVALFNTAMRNKSIPTWEAGGREFMDFKGIQDPELGEGIKNRMTADLNDMSTVTNGWPVVRQNKGK